MSDKSPRPPQHLSAESKRFWQWACAEFVLEQHDLKLLALLCDNLDAAAEARHLVETQGRTYTDARGQVRSNPAVAQFRDASITAARLLRELRLSEPAKDARPNRLPPFVKGRPNGHAPITH